MLIHKHSGMEVQDVPLNRFWNRCAVMQLGTNEDAP